MVDKSNKCTGLLVPYIDRVEDLQNVRTVTAYADDLSSKARIREAALELFATKGSDQVSIRRIARHAGVSPNLVMHYYRSKEGLRAAVDDAAFRRFGDAFARAAQTAHTREDVAAACAHEIFVLAREEPHLADYLSRTLVEGGPSAARTFDGLFALARAELLRLREAGVVRSTVEVDIQALQSVSRWLAPLLLRPLLNRHLPAPIDCDEQLQRWLSVQVDLLENGLFVASSSARPASTSRPEIAEPLTHSPEG
jgi:AcrR family transcriptional regulator